MIALFFDTETTGFKTDNFTPEIVQIGAILQDTETGRTLSEINLIVRPQGKIPEQVVAIHGIDDELADTYGIDQSRAETLFARIAQMADTVVAHNIEFDIQMLELNWPFAWGMVQGRTQFCTMRSATDIIKLPPGTYHQVKYSKYKPPKLIEVYQYFFDGKTFDNTHDAMADVRACRDVFFAMQPLLAAKQEIVKS